VPISLSHHFAVCIFSFLHLHPQILAAPALSVHYIADPYVMLHTKLETLLRDVEMKQLETVVPTGGTRGAGRLCERLTDRLTTLKHLPGSLTVNQSSYVL